VSFLYVARLAPVNRDLIANSPISGVTHEYFERSIFALERKQPERVKVLLDHDERREVGQLAQLTVNRGWLEGVFYLDETRSWSGVAEDRLKLGTPVSIAYTSQASSDWKGDGLRRMLVGELHELSIVKHGAIPGAEIIMTIPRRSKPKAPQRQAVGEVIYGGPLIRRPGIGQVLGVR
jgi:hypothetical protein